jgi:DNA-binding beta-propeller fold protein YncE
LSGVALVALWACASITECSSKTAEPPLHLAQRIPLPGVKGRIDHLAVDVPGQRLFVCALGNDSVEVLDLQKGQRVHSIAGLGSPQGIAYVAQSKRFYVANDKGGLCEIYDAKSFAPLGQVNLQSDADNVRYDSAARQIYVGHGSGGLAIIDAGSGKEVRTINLPGHPEAFALEKKGPRIFVNVPTARRIAVVDRTEAKVIAEWKTGSAFSNFPMALDEEGHRLFVACRRPSRLVVLNTDNGEVVTSFSISGDADDIFYDRKRHRLYVICGEGNIDLIEQVNADSYKVSATTETGAGARTGLFVPELKSLFVAVPAHGDQGAEIRRFTVE